ncbi:ABC transporter substrate-binding protein [Flexithrix dorotheae]|uniref:ABC transporter substrate-binding protein n=1 Tax=Flexithrix dorotheae TaxID=70993 RepID=UPI0005C5EE53|nr:ABC transporter substrate-binding protein [Flexithrix dorotheae]
MKQILFILSILSIGIYSCQTNNAPENNIYNLTKTKGDKYYGGVFRLNESEYIKNLFPLSIIDVYSYRVASQIYEGLFKFNPEDITDVKTCLIDSYEVNPEKTEYTFKLRKGIFFHDDECFENNKGRELTSEDIRYCFTKLCTEDRKNQSFNLFDGIVKGASEYYAATKGGATPNFDIEGIKIIDKYSFKIELIKPNSIFLYNLARPGAFIYPKEAYEKYGIEMRTKCVGTGPFQIDLIDEDISILLKKNKNYYKKDDSGNQLPYMEAISIQFIKDKKMELLEFKKGNLDMMYRLPTDHIIEILDETISDDNTGFSQYELQREPEISTQFLAFNNQSEVFGNLNIRKAFNFAVDREKILDYILNGEGYGIGEFGFTPPSFNNYDISKFNGYDLNLDSAKYYLKKAGYPNGKNFPILTLDLNTEGERYTNVAVELQKQLKDHLNIDIEINIAPLAQITEKSMSGNFDFLRLAWVADYPSPENFLWMFYGANLPTEPNANSYPNFIRYKNEQFDTYYEKAINSLSEEEALANFRKAEEIMLRDAPVLILWYDEGYRLVQSYVKNFPNNPMQFRDFTDVYLTPKNTEKDLAANNIN